MPLIQVDPEDLYQKLMTFYQESPKAERKLFDLLETRWTSMRLIEHFVGKYCKPNAVRVPIREAQRAADGTITVITRPMGVHASYQSHLDMFTKKYFDCCARGDRITYRATSLPGKNIITTLGQLNFIRWLILFGIIKFIRQNLALIRAHMQASIVDSQPRLPQTAGGM